MDSPFHIGVPMPPPANRVIRIRPSAQRFTFDPHTWTERQTTLPAAGTIRLFDDPSSAPNFFVSCCWDRDRSLTEWINDIEHRRTELSDPSGFTVSLYPNGYADDIERVFMSTQRKRWLARKVLMKWTQRVWRRKPQCNIDLIEMSPIAEIDAVYVTDTTIKQVYRFHRRDVFNTLLSNICMCDEMLPNPRPPANPFTNAPLRLPQIIGLCEQLVRYYGAQGRCPPTLFAAFCASRYDVRRFASENASLLSQHAIATYFKNHSVENQEAVIDTMLQLITEANHEITPPALRRWLRTTPHTPQHGDWLRLVRDYTLYMNLHVQVRPTWTSPLAISAEVRRLYNRTEFPDGLSVRVRQLRDAVREGLRAPPLDVTRGWSLPLILRPPLPPRDASGGAADMSDELILQLIQNALFRM
jgi:hypothetical protein